MRDHVLAVLLALACSIGSGAGVAAQVVVGESPAAESFVGSETERYLRLLQSTGEARTYPWSVRGFSPQEIDRIAPTDSAHPWVNRYTFGVSGEGGLRLGVIAPHVTSVYNSAFPYGPNAGPVWAGRGLTTAVQAGAWFRAGPASLVLAPVAFRAENRGFPLMDNGHAGRLRYGDGLLPTVIDLPQRFGDEAYGRIDPGQSTLRLDLPGVALGVSTANQHWGPAAAQPILLGSNAPGFAHAFLGTSAPLNVWVGRLHGRMVWGRLEQSDHSPVESAETRRFMAGMVGTFSPRGAPGLEVGAGRFFHSVWPTRGPGLADFLKPLEGFIKERLPDTDNHPDDPKVDEHNQLASIFFRWVLPGSGFEMYGEFGREDHNWNVRDLVAQPDHVSSYLLGFSRVWRKSGETMLAVRGEVLNAQASHLERVRYQAPFYIHTPVVQGHTHRGQVLGATGARGGASAMLAVDRYHRGGRWTASWSRELRQERNHYRITRQLDPGGLDVLHALGVESLFFVGPLDVSAGVRGVYNLNRNFESDVFNLNATLGVRAAVR